MLVLLYHGTPPSPGRPTAAVSAASAVAFVELVGVNFRRTKLCLSAGLYNDGSVQDRSLALQKLLASCAALAGVLVFGSSIAQPSAAPASGAVPPGAAALGYTRRVIYLTPTTGDISYDGTVKNLYSGDWYRS